MKSFGGITPFSDALAAVLKQHNLERKIREHELIERWDEVVGKPVSNYAAPLRLVNGVLYLQVSEAMWRHEIALKRTELIKAINARLESELVTEIVLR